MTDNPCGRMTLMPARRLRARRDTTPLGFRLECTGLGLRQGLVAAERSAPQALRCFCSPRLDFPAPGFGRLQASPQGGVALPQRAHLLHLYANKPGIA